MTLFQRIYGIITALVSIVCALILLFVPNDGYYIVLLILSISLLFYGIRQLVYFFSMARHMAGGRIFLYIGIILIDVAVFSLTLADIGFVWVMAYMLVIYAFSGVIDVLRAFEQKRGMAPHWGRKLANGIAGILIAALCACFTARPAVLCIIYSLGLIYYAIVKIVRAFRRTSIAYSETVDFKTGDGSLS